MLLVAAGLSSEPNAVSYPAAACSAQQSLVSNRHMMHRSCACGRPSTLSMVTCQLLNCGPEAHQQQHALPVLSTQQAHLDSCTTCCWYLQELVEAVVLPIQHKDRFEKLGIRPPKGVLLYGAPGTGKTLLARACAAQTNATFLKLAGAVSGGKSRAVSKSLWQDSSLQTSNTASSLFTTPKSPTCSAAAQSPACGSSAGLWLYLVPGFQVSARQTQQLHW